NGNSQGDSICVVAPLPGYCACDPGSQPPCPNGQNCVNTGNGFRCRLSDGGIPPLRDAGAGGNDGGSDGGGGGDSGGGGGSDGGGGGGSDGGGADSGGGGADSGGGGADSGGGGGSDGGTACTTSQNCTDPARPVCDTSVDGGTCEPCGSDFGSGLPQ